MAEFVKLKSGNSEIVVNVNHVIHISSSGPTKSILILSEFASGVTVHHSIEELKAIFNNRNKDGSWH